jgi:hypothetical protein
MNDCARVRELIVLHAEGELDPEQARQVAEHLSGCRECSQQAEDISTLRAWLTGPEIFAPAENDKWRSFAAVCARSAGAARMRRFQFARGSLRWALPAAAALLFAVGLFWMSRRPDNPAVAVGLPAPGNEAFLGKIQSAVTVDATAQYLARCQDLLVDMLRAEQTCTGNGYDVSFEIARARDLLLRKRILDSELNAPEVARAKDLCDDLENLLVDLSLSQSCETPDRFRSMGHVIEREKLLLRIKLVQSEIS